MTSAMIFRDIGKSPDENLDSMESDELEKHYGKILTGLTVVACKELEAYLAINSCRNYDQLANLIMKRERINLRNREYDKLLGRLRTRAHRGREKVLKKIRDLYETES